MMMSKFTNKQINIILPILLFALAFITKFMFIDSRDVCVDEPFTIFNAQKSVLEIIKLPTQNEPNPPLFMLLLHWWMSLFGSSALSVRILPLLFNSATAVALFFIGKQLKDKWAGVLTSLIFILSTYHFYFGMETRAYSMLSFGTSLGLFAFLKLIENPESRKNVILLIVANFIIMYSHYFGLFALFAQFVIGLIYYKNKVFFKKIIIALITSAVLFVPMAIVFIGHFLKFTEGTVVRPPKWIFYFDELIYFTNGSFSMILIVLVILFGWLIKRLKYSSEEKKNLKIILLWWVVPFTAMFLISFKLPMFANRYVLFHTIGFFATIGLLVSMGKMSKTYRIIASLIVLVAIGARLRVNSKKFFYREVKNAVEKVKELKDENTLVVIHPAWANVGFMYYYAPEIFQDVEGFNEKQSLDNILPVYNKQMVQDHLKANPQYKRVVYYQDGSLFIDPKNSIKTYLKEEFTFQDSVFYPQCFFVSKFDLEQE